MFHLDPPETFPFPFPPYDIQKELMEQIYKTLEDGKLAILESPTGTGKTLSLICGALTWLRDHEKREKDRLEEEAKMDTSDTQSVSSDDWLTVQFENLKKKAKALESQKQLEAIMLYEEKVENFSKKRDKLKIELEVGMAAKRPGQSDKAKAEPLKKKVDDAENIEDSDSDLLLPDMDIITDVSYFRLDSDSDDDDYEKLEKTPPVKIYFCSRTHSQLAQVVGEVQRSPFGSSVRVVSLASRQNYCINVDVQKLKSLTLINEKCTDLRQKKSNTAPPPLKKQRKSNKEGDTDSKCQFVQSAGSLEMLRLTSMLEVLDIEQLVRKGKELKACPYYGARSSLEDAQLVLLPYTTLLHPDTREASGINLKGAVVIIDEAHNLLDTISHIHSAEVSGRQLTYAHSQLKQYLERYVTRLSAQNVLYVRQLLFIISQFITVLGGRPGEDSADTGEGGEGTSVLDLDDFLCGVCIDNINICGLLEFCEKSKLPHKLNSFAERYQASTVSAVSKPQENVGLKGLKGFLSNLKTTQNTPAAENEPIVEDVNIGRNPILPFLAVLKKLSCDNKDGRMVCTKKATVGSGIIKFLMLNPASQFADIVRDARAVIVAGGTMQPMSEFRVQLFERAEAETDRITDFSCGHVVPQENILTLIVPSGPSGMQMNFSFKNRHHPDLVNELGRSLVNLSCVVPAGIVVFFPSYDYEKFLFEIWSNNNIITSIEKKKKVFREPKTSGCVDQVLAKFAQHIKQCNNSTSPQTGAVLFSVVGGKMSEGINFSDDLGRCVVVVGMPYPNKYSPELKEKMSYLNTHCSPRKGKCAGQMYYEDLCMKAVNQCIGRAVRHRADYATMVLLDNRYDHENVKAALPRWIQSSVNTVSKFGQVIGLTKKFFVGMNQSRHVSDELKKA